MIPTFFFLSFPRRVILVNDKGYDLENCDDDFLNEYNAHTVYLY